MNDQQSAVTRMLEHITSELTAIDREQRFRDMLDECYSFDAVGGPFACMSPSKVLEEMDPTAFRCGVNDYMDGENTVEIDGEDYDRREAEKAKEEFIDDLNDEITDAENDFDEDDEDADRTELDRLIAERDECEKYDL